MADEEKTDPDGTPFDPEATPTPTDPCSICNARQVVRVANWFPPLSGPAEAWRIVDCISSHDGTLKWCPVRGVYEEEFCAPVKWERRATPRGTP